MPTFMLGGPRPCAIFCFALIHYMHELRNQNVSLGYGSSVSSKQLMAKKENKNI